MKRGSFSLPLLPQVATIGTLLLLFYFRVLRVLRGGKLELVFGSPAFAHRGSLMSSLH